MYKHGEFFYKEKGDHQPGPKLPWPDYLAAVKRMVRYSVDILLVNIDGNFVLPKRRVDKSGAGTWFIGGQVPAFTTTADALTAILQRETNITVDSSRFLPLKQLRIWFTGKEERGFAHDALSDVHTLQLQAEEIANIRLDPEEYDSESIQVYNLNDLQNLPDGLFKEIILTLWDLYHIK